MLASGTARTAPCIVCLALGLALGAAATRPAAARPDDPRAEGRSAGPSRAGRAVDEARELAAQAHETWDKDRDARRAWKLIDRAVRKAPDHARTRLDRAMLLVRMLPALGDDRRRRQALERIDEDLRAVERLAPRTILAGVARDMRRELSGRTLIPRQGSVRCSSAEGIEAFEQAEALFNAGRLEESLAHYRRAAQACPDDAPILTAWADAHYALGQLDRAEELFVRSLLRDPWQRATRRYLMDVYLRRGNLEAAFDQAVHAVIADPTYEAGWEALRMISPHVGREYRRVHGERPDIEQSADRATTVTLSPGALGSGDASAGETGDWMVFALLLAGADEPPDDAPAPLFPEVSRIRRILETICDDGSAGDGGKGSSGHGPFWSMICRAVAAGYAPEAAYMHLLDRRLAAEYPRYREQHADRLRTYVLELLVPPRAGPGSQ
ncbi:MAG: hypothetical protein Kow0062_27450 [Acidobacteriota bacterium]